jgi:catechol 2,3-dioxygenase-like lactoylglutathione lyase family enzyme
MRMELAVPVIPADDITQARQFYVDKLGFQVTFEASDDGKSGIMGVKRGSMEITIDAPMDGHGRQACVSLRVGDADAYYREWRDKVDIKHPPKDEYWGARTFGLQDPSDNTIFVIGPLRQA